MKEIIKGVARDLLEGDSPESIRKMDICNKCDSKVEDVIFGDRCKECGCVLKYKTKSDSKCPLDKW